MCLPGAPSLWHQLDDLFHLGLRPNFPDRSSRTETSAHLWFYWHDVHDDHPISDSSSPKSHGRDLRDHRHLSLRSILRYRRMDGNPISVPVRDLNTTSSFQRIRHLCVVEMDLQLPGGDDNACRDRQYWMANLYHLGSSKLLIHFCGVFLLPRDERTYSGGVGSDI